MGGGAIRAAAKVAGIKVGTGGFRSITAEHGSFSPAAARNVTPGRPAVAAAGDVNLVTSNLESGVQKPCFEFDDWVFPIVEEEMVGEAVDPMPRVVFGGVPNFEEAKEATSELSVALERTFLSSPNSAGYEGSVVADDVSSLPLSNKEDVETKTCISSEIIGVPTVPAPAIMAFKFLHESSVAKDVVASIACDPNVWNAMLQNQELQKFLQSQKTCVACTDNNVGVEFDCNAKSSDGSSEYAGSESGNGFRDFFQNMKSTVVDMLSSLSDYFKDLFAGKGTNINSDTVMERSFMGLAVMAILVILLKRA